MDIYSFINSKAIREHLHEIKYEFNTLEAAWLIYQCRSKSMQEKHDAWNELIQTMPDCEVEERMYSGPFKSFHRTLERYMEIENRLLETFMKHKDLDVYQLRYYCTGDDDWCELKDELYYSPNACFSVIDEVLDDGVEVFEITNRTIGIGKCITVTFRVDKTVLKVDSEGYLDRDEDAVMYMFEDMYHEFPVPFQKGDVLIDRSAYGPQKLFGFEGPLVLNEASPWDTERNAIRKAEAAGDNTDMTVRGYFQDEDGRIFYESAWNYMDFDYYTKPLKRQHKLLFAIGNFIKEKISLDLLLTAYRKTIMDEIADDPMLKGWYTHEGLELAGLDSEEDDNEQKDSKKAD